MNIKGGYILQPRSIDDSEVAKYPPHIREIWLYLLRKAEYKDIIVSGKEIKRGQLLTSYSEILDDLSWQIGFRKESYSNDQCSSAMKALRKASMITTTRTTRGLIITICKYDYYQDSTNYENLTENPNDNHIGNHNENPPIYKEVKKEEDISCGNSTNLPPDQPKPKNINYQSIVALFHRVCVSLPKVKKLTDPRKDKIKTRVRELEKQFKGVDYMTVLEGLFQKMEDSDFMRGNNKNDWQGTFDWLFSNGSNWVKVFEGNYDNKKTTVQEKPAAYIVPD
jgi:hypothetical protein